MVVGFDDGDAIVRHRQHERAAVVPVDIDLRPFAVFVNFNDGPQRSNGDRVWILRHRYQADKIRRSRSRFQLDLQIDKSWLQSERGSRTYNPYGSQQIYKKLRI
jgi:hypothetical protein